MRVDKEHLELRSSHFTNLLDVLSNLQLNMPVIPTGGKVLVSGANGYVAMWVVRILLEKGYSVRGTVRSEEKGKFLADYFTELGYGTKFEFFIVEDITKDGAFDEVVKDVDAIEHTASPFTYNVKEPDALLKPAVQGTVGMLRSALKAGSQIKRIVITSSVAAIINPTTEPRVWNEDDWNTSAAEEFERLGAATSSITLYRLSKTLAEQAAWDFYKKYKSQLSWDLTMINPSLVFGPPIQDLKSPSALNTSLATWFDTVVRGEGKLSMKEGLAVTSSWVDVRDTALGHVLALQKEEAGGQRITTSASGFIWQEWLNTANALENNPLKATYPNLPHGFPEIIDENPERIIHIDFDPSKEQRILGIKYRTLTETTKDTLEEFARRGW
ncbi:D-lactaldehyde dehydrogenase [Crepidotus variabilis]|uniref:D-lactaldehyde dehydrogenase n=1 Tax=Crepidotus variabilis TaxID=179855 RepID=A0A9P6EIW3_9AGAR|nr:D-lactaldehyde dehydrogenase [Crepidotus variabilis]